MTPLFSIAIPAHQDRPRLARLLDRLEGEGAPLEVIVVDDASDDGAAEMLAARRPPPHIALRVVRNAANLGPGPSRNAALEMVSAPFTLFLDADDMIHRDAFACLSEALPRAPVDFTLFRHHLVTRADRPFTYRMMAGDEALWAAARARCGGRAGGMTGALTLADAPELAGMVNYPWTRLFRTEFLRARHLRFPDLRLHEDVPFHWAAWLAADRFMALDHAPPLVHHFQLDQGGRATDVDDARRLDAFRALNMTLDAEPRLSSDPAVAAVFARFAEGLTEWAAGRLARGPHHGAARAAAAQVRQRLGAIAEALDLPAREALDA
jgi:cellulose synthase/poly-beta-1,6-N-acetylglucosamine synthase-like glycosyltransferase